MYDAGVLGSLTAVVLPNPFNRASTCDTAQRGREKLSPGPLVGQLMGLFAGLNDKRPRCRIVEDQLRTGE
jgi:hypothetical protein